MFAKVKRTEQDRFFAGGLAARLRLVPEECLRRSALVLPPSPPLPSGRSGRGRGGPQLRPGRLRRQRAARPQRRGAEAQPLQLGHLHRRHDPGRLQGGHRHRGEDEPLRHQRRAVRQAAGRQSRLRRHRALQRIRHPHAHRRHARCRSTSPRSRTARTSCRASRTRRSIPAGATRCPTPGWCWASAIASRRVDGVPDSWKWVMDSRPLQGADRPVLGGRRPDRAGRQVPRLFGAQHSRCR